MRVLHWLFLALSLCPGFARADGLSDLKAALTQLKASTPLKALVEVKTLRRNGADEDQGQVSIGVEDAGHGLQLSYSRELQLRFDVEQRARIREPNARTPALTALKDIDASEIFPMVSAAPGLARIVERSAFKGERVDNYNGKPARLLSFELPLESLVARDRKVTRNFESTVDIWIGADGVPLASRARQLISGRAFVVVGFESLYEEQFVFGVAGDRLLTLRRESRFDASGAGEKDMRRIVRTLQPLPHNL
ncbi:MAG: hypothetical protein V4508_05510 [Pseudomonadota bacterium]